MQQFLEAANIQIGLERIRPCRYKDKESRLNVVLLQQQSSVLNFVLPIRNQCRELDSACKL